MNSVTINGKTYKGTKSVVVKNDTVYVDGKKVDHGEAKNGILEIKVDGVLGSLEADGSVECGLVQGTVQAGGSVHCDKVDGDVQAGGSVHAGKVEGNIMAGGSVRHG